MKYVAPEMEMMNLLAADVIATSPEEEKPSNPGAGEFEADGF